MRARTIEEKRAYQRAYYHAHKEEIKAYQKEYRAMKRWERRKEERRQVIPQDPKDFGWHSARTIQNLPPSQVVRVMSRLIDINEPT